MQSQPAPLPHRASESLSQSPLRSCPSAELASTVRRDTPASEELVAQADTLYSDRAYARIDLSLHRATCGPPHDHSRSNVASKQRPSPFYRVWREKIVGITRTAGITVDVRGNRLINKQHRGIRIFLRLGVVGQENAEERLRTEVERMDLDRDSGARPLFRHCAARYLAQSRNKRSIETIE